jgi:signal transduction histidine kinase
MVEVTVRRRNGTLSVSVRDDGAGTWLRAKLPTKS